MTHTQTNVGHVDGLARRIIGGAAVRGALMSLDAIFRGGPFLTWIVLSFTFTVGLFFLMGGFRSGTGYFGILLMALSVADAWMALNHLGQWALIAGIIVAADGFLTAAYGSPLNRLLHKDTHDADRDWMLTSASAH